MGREAECTLTTQGRSVEGVARLEARELVVRGPGTRLAIPLGEITGVHARDGRLFVTFAGRRVVLALGAEAGRWADRIAHPPSRLDKLGVKPGMRVLLIDHDDATLVEELTKRGAVVDRTERGDGADLVFFAARTPRDLERLAALTSRIVPNGAIWLIRTKGRNAPITEAQSMAAGKAAGLVDVKVVSYSDTESAEKYVIPVARRAGARRSAPARRIPGSASSRART